jgi:hypothetical protein
MVSFYSSNSSDSSNTLTLNTKEGCEYALEIINMKLIPKFQKQIQDCKDDLREDEDQLFQDMESKASIYNNEYNKFIENTICLKRWWYNFRCYLPDFLEELRLDHIDAINEFHEISSYNEDMRMNIRCIEHKIKQLQKLANSLELCKFGGTVNITGVEYEMLNDIESYQEKQKPYR